MMENELIKLFLDTLSKYCEDKLRQLVKEEVRKEVSFLINEAFKMKDEEKKEEKTDG